MKSQLYKDKEALLNEQEANWHVQEITAAVWLNFLRCHLLYRKSVLHNVWRRDLNYVLTVLVASNMLLRSLLRLYRLDCGVAFSDGNITKSSVIMSSCWLGITTHIGSYNHHSVLLFSHGYCFEDSSRTQSVINVARFPPNKRTCALHRDKSKYLEDTISTERRCFGAVWNTKFVLLTLKTF